jgi:hypothetical protein
MDPAHVRLDRLNGGAPLLDSHSAYSVSDILGTVVPGSVQTTKKALLATVRFSKRASVDEIWQDVKGGIVRDVSIGYRVFAYEEKPGKGPGAPAVRTATSWEPFECSLVPIPADAGAKVRGEEPADANACEIVQPAPPEPAPATSEVTEARAETEPQESVAEGEEAMPDQKRAAESFVADLSLTPPPKPAATPEPSDRDKGAEAERVRCMGIHKACRNARMPVALEEDLIAKGVTLEAAQTRILEEIATRDMAGTPAPVAGATRVEVTGDDPFLVVRDGITEALLYKAHPYQPERRDGFGRVVEGERGFKLTDKGREYMGLKLLRIAERFLVTRGIRTERLNDNEIAGMALGLTRGDGMHTTTDFANLLADVAGKTLRQAYIEAPQTFSPITRRTFASDFKDIKRLQLGEAPALEVVGEHGEIKSGTVGEAKETYHLSTYAKKFAITRKALINDDLDAFSRLPLMFGRQARNIESDIVWACITGNLDATGAAISVDSISAGRLAMRTQTGIDGTTYLNINPRYLIVPAALETLAQQFVTAITPAQASNVNPFVGQLQVIAEPRLDANSTIAWYLAAAVADMQDVLELALLEGQDGPLVEQEVGFDVDGIKIRCRHDIGAKAIDWRGLYKNNGTT